MLGKDSDVSVPARFSVLGVVRHVLQGVGNLATEEADTIALVEALPLHARAG